MKKYLILVNLLVISMCLEAQEFTNISNVSPVEKDGFYRIHLTPEINGQLKEDYSDLRLYDQKKQEIPYLVRKEKVVVTQQLFHPYEMVEFDQKEGCCTQLTIHNKNKNKINNIALLIKNADVAKEARLSGSNDLDKWFVVKDHYLLQSLESRDRTDAIKVLHFPMTDYTYYRLDINDSNSAALNILKAGYYDQYARNGNYSRVPDPVIRQTDSLENRKTYVEINFPGYQYIDKLELSVSGPAYFLRNVQLAELVTVQQKKREARSYFSKIMNFQLNSTQPTSINLSNYRVKSCYLIIDNADNPVLQIDSVQAYQINRYMDAYLKKNGSYALLFGNQKLSKPNYDLKYFNDSIPASPPLLSISSPGEISEETESVESSIFDNSIWIWTAIILVCILLGLVSYKMVKEMGKG